MAVEKSSLSLDSSESESEELPTFAFLKKEPSSTKRRQPQKEEKIVVVDISDSEASCPPSPKLRDPPPVPETAETVIRTEPVRVLSSGSEDEEEFAPLAERLTCKFLTHKQLSPEDSSSPVIRSILFVFYYSKQCTHSSEKTGWLPRGSQCSDMNTTFLT